MLGSFIYKSTQKIDGIIILTSAAEIVILDTYLEEFWEFWHWKCNVILISILVLSVKINLCKTIEFIQSGVIKNNL